MYLSVVRGYHFASCFQPRMDRPMCIHVNNKPIPEDFGTTCLQQTQKALSLLRDIQQNLAEQRAAINTQVTKQLSSETYYTKFRLINN